MKWSKKQVEQLKSLAFAGASNLNIAKQLGIKVSDVYAKRSQLGITIDKVKEKKAGTMNSEMKTAVPIRNANMVKVQSASPKKRAPGEITHDLRIQLQSLSNALDESHFLIVELLDVLGLLE